MRPRRRARAPVGRARTARIEQYSEAAPVAPNTAKLSVVGYMMKQRSGEDRQGRRQQGRAARPPDLDRHEVGERDEQRGEHDERHRAGDVGRPEDRH